MSTTDSAPTVIINNRSTLSSRMFIALVGGSLIATMGLCTTYVADRVSVGIGQKNDQIDYLRTKWRDMHDNYIDVVDRADGLADDLAAEQAANETLTAEKGAALQRASRAEGRVAGLTTRVSGLEVANANLTAQNTGLIKDNTGLVKENRKLKADVINGRATNAAQASLIVQLKTSLSEAWDTITSLNGTVAARSYAQFESDTQLEICDHGTRNRVAGCRDMVRQAMRDADIESQYTTCVTSGQAEGTLGKGRHARDVELGDTGFYVHLCDATLPEAP